MGGGMDDLAAPHNLAAAETENSTLRDAGDSPHQPDGGLASSIGGETADLLASLVRGESSITSCLAELLRELREKMALDRFREEQIDRLHAELQIFRNDLVAKTARQLIQGLVRLHDDLARSAAALREKPREEFTPELLFKQLADFQDDVELLLGQHGVERFEGVGEVFDPRRQTAARTVATDDPGKVGRIAERVRPGFAQGEALLQKERVAVFAASNAIHLKEQGGQT